jgi:hypothetical protein
LKFGFSRRNRGLKQMKIRGSKESRKRRQHNSQMNLWKLILSQMKRMKEALRSKTNRKSFNKTTRVSKQVKLRFRTYCPAKEGIKLMMKSWMMNCRRR